jgi:predicted  nucleic acid-binding Zn-ribbon protein
MASKTDGERIDRLEQVMQILAEDQVSLRELVAELATETRRGFDQVREQFAETDRHMRETDAHLRETEALMRESGRQTDERISNLVSAIGNPIVKLDSPRN